MDLLQVLHMNKGSDDFSYARNCIVQKEIISAANPILDKAVSEYLHNNTATSEFQASVGIADLGCSSGPNTFMVISEMIDAIHNTSCEMGLKTPELRVSLNDLPGNDFNDVVMNLPEFYKKLQVEKGIGSDRCFVSCVAGSFYGRLFPSRSMHFLHSSSSLHWLSQAPVVGNTNKGKIYISKTSPVSVSTAYLRQFEKDFQTFLKSRAEEMVLGGVILLSFMGRLSPDTSAQVGSHQWELIAQALTSMALEGLVEEDKIDSFNVPYYAPCLQELRHIILKEGSFKINHLQGFELDWDGGDSRDNQLADDEEHLTTRGQRVACIHRAVTESMLEFHFGSGIMDELFRRYARLVDDGYAKGELKLVDLVVSLVRKS